MFLRPIHKRFAYRAAFLLALFIVLGTAYSTPAEASILLPETGLQGDNSLDAERLIAEMEMQESSSSGASSSGASSSVNLPPAEEEQRPQPQEEQLAWQIAAMASQTEGSTTGTSSSPSGSSNVGGGASLLADFASILPDNSLVERYYADWVFSISDAPGTKLLRPPQPLSLI